MKRNTRPQMMLTALATGGSLAVLSCPSWAQPPVAPPPAAPNAAPAAPFDPNTFDWRSATPEQRSRAMAEVRRLGQRRQLANLGVTETGIQDAILEFLEEQQAARLPLEEKGRRLAVSLHPDTLTDAQVASALADYQADIEAEAARAETAAQQLDAKVHYISNPRLHAVLVLLGALGNSPSLSLDSGRGMRGLGGRGMGGRGLDLRGFGTARPNAVQPGVILPPAQQGTNRAGRRNRRNGAPQAETAPPANGGANQA